MESACSKSKYSILKTQQEPFNDPSKAPFDDWILGSGR
jgi:hypothetical protein